MKKYLAYCRVSTKAQADRDNSLPAQKRIIQEYAQRKGFEIVEWYSEAKSGFKGKRGEFRNMLEQLKDPLMEGVVFHKLDRSSRNVGDFSLLDKLMTKEGKKIVVIEGEFDTSRSAGRLAFRNFCNMCVWYSENLSEEVTTKMVEVLRKGYYPAQTPLGYRTGVKGQDDDWKKKYPDSAVAPFVKESFELFATGNYSIRTLCDYMRKRGMTNSNGGMLRKGVFERMLRNTFYHGLITWNKKDSDEKICYEGNHEPIVSKKTFDKVQEILDGRTQKEKTKHNYTYTKMIRCECGNYLITSKHKDHIYLECQNKDCKFTSIREDVLEDQVIVNLARYELAEDFVKYSKEAVKRLSGGIREDNQAKRQALNMKLTQLDNKLQKLNNAVIEGFFDPQEGIAEKNRIVEQKHILQIELSEMEDKKETALWDLTSSVIMLFNFLPYGYRNLNPVIKRRLLTFLFSNLRLEGKKLLVQAIPEFEKIRFANYRMQGEKLTSNHLPNAETPQEKATSDETEIAFCSNLPNGRGERTRTFDLTVPNRAL